MSKSTMTLCCETLWARFKLQYAHDHSQNVHVITCIYVAHDERGDPTESSICMHWVEHLHFVKYFTKLMNNLINCNIVITKHII